jgi:hypothetical protein
MNHNETLSYRFRWELKAQSTDLSIIMKGGKHSRLKGRSAYYNDKIIQTYYKDCGFKRW